MTELMQGVGAEKYVFIFIIGSCFRNNTHIRAVADDFFFLSYFCLFSVILNQLLERERGGGGGGAVEEVETEKF